jgi:hypothetical protein
MRQCRGLACFACLVFLQLTSSSQADQFDDARAYFDNGDTKKGIELLNSIAETGDAATQYRVGTELIGFGDSGIRWIESAAERGHAEAQADMGLLYASGTFVKQNLRGVYVVFPRSQGRPGPLASRRCAEDRQERVWCDDISGAQRGRALDTELETAIA